MKRKWSLWCSSLLFFWSFQESIFTVMMEKYIKKTKQIIIEMISNAIRYISGSWMAFSLAVSVLFLNIYIL